MRQIECQRGDCPQQTFLIDETVTLDKGWSMGIEPSGMPYYVCPFHRAAYVLTPMPSAIITKPEPEAASDAVPAGRPASVEEQVQAELARAERERQASEAAKAEKSDRETIITKPEPEAASDAVPQDSPG